MNKGQLAAIIYERLNYGSSPDTAVVTRIGNHLNQAHRMILREPGMQQIRNVTPTWPFSSIASISYYGMPGHMASITSIIDVTNERKLRPLSRREVITADPLASAGGPPYGYQPWGVRPYKFQPSGGIWAVSSSASDTTQTVQVNGIRTGGLMSGDQTATLNGLTRAAVGGGSAFIDYLDIQSVSLSAVAVGLVSLYDAATLGNVLAEIPIGHLYPQYVGIQLYPKPSGVVSYIAEGIPRILDMDDTVDVPNLPEEFHDLLVPAAMMLEYEKTKDSRYPLAVATYRDGLSALRYYLAANDDIMPTLLRPRSRGTSRLGAWFPADY